MADHRATWLFPNDSQYACSVEQKPVWSSMTQPRHIEPFRICNWVK